MTLTATRDVLCFTLGEQALALDATLVQEVVRLVAVSPLPGAPASVEGVVNVRGVVVPVLDPRVKFGWTPAAHAVDQHLILVRAAGRVVALRVDRATALRSVPSAALVNTANVLPGIAHTAGVVRLDDGVLVLHDVARFFSLEEVAQLDGALSAIGATA